MKQYALRNKIVIGRQFLESDPIKGIAYFEEVINEMSSHLSEEDYIDLAFAYQDLNQLEKALQTYLLMKEHYPECSRVYYGIAMMYEELQMLQEAIEHYKTAIKMNPDYFEALFYLAGIYDDLDMVDESMTCYHRAYEINPNDYWVNVNLGSVYESIDQDLKAYTYFQRALSIEVHYMAIFNLGVIAKKQNNIEESIACYQKVITLQPDYGYAYLNLSVIYRDRNDLKAAIDILTQGINKTEKISYLYYHRACNFALSGDKENAMKDLAEAIRLYPDFENYMKQDEDLKFMKKEMESLFHKLS